MNQNHAVFNRRRLLVGSTALAAGAATGCRQEPELTVVKTERRDVPLRILITGRQDDAAAIGRGWSTVSDQPLDIQAIELDRADASSLFAAVRDEAKKSDVILFPLAMVAQLAGEKVIVAISEDEFEQIEQTAGKLLPSPANGAARHAGEYFSIPLGAAVPVLLSPEEIGEVESWGDYDQLVAQQWNSMAAEPLAPGWAGAMFLRRAAGIPTWLFRREDFDPVINTEPYMDALQLMARTCARYKSEPRTPGEVWEGIQAGELKGGIGYPVGQISSDTEVFIKQAPGLTKSSKLMFDPFTLMISLSADCRQSVAAKRFIGWISGGESSESVRRQVSGMTVVRSSPAISSLGESMDVSDKYDRWLAERLQTPLTMPTLQIFNSGEYYQVLEQQVQKCLRGDATVQDALGEVAAQWRSITKAVGSEKQQRAWRRAQGMRA